MVAVAARCDAAHIDGGDARLEVWNATEGSSWVYSLKFEMLS
jgi:hypothetical protein